MSADLQSASVGSADPYVAAWEGLRKRRRAVAISVLAGLPTAILASLGGPQSAASPFSVAVRVLLFAIFFTGVAATVSLWLFNCPRCHQLFHTRDWFRNPSIFREVQCPHCGIEMGTPKG